MKNRYFFHATTARQETDEYGQDDGEADDEIKTEIKEKDETKPEGRDTPQKAYTEPKIEDEDPSLAEWFKIEPETEEMQAKVEDSATEDDSDNEDNINADQGVMDDLDDWVDSKPEEKVSPHTFKGNGLIVQVDEDVKMGADNDAMHYDQNLIFKHL